jgi:hypothetical protein
VISGHVVVLNLEAIASVDAQADTDINVPIGDLSKVTDGWPAVSRAPSTVSKEAAHSLKIFAVYRVLIDVVVVIGRAPGYGVYL